MADIDLTWHITALSCRRLMSPLPQERQPCTADMLSSSRTSSRHPDIRVHHWYRVSGQPSNHGFGSGSCAGIWVRWPSPKLMQPTLKAGLAGLSLTRENVSCCVRGETRRRRSKRRREAELPVEELDRRLKRLVPHCPPLRCGPYIGRVWTGT